MNGLDRDRLRPWLRTTRHLSAHAYPAHPFRVTASGPATSDRGEHVREQIEQLLMTAPGERVHRPDWGVGAEVLVFEPSAERVRTLMEQRLTAALAEALLGEVVPESLRTSVDVAAEHTIVVRVGYRLATIGRDVDDVFTVGM